MAEQWLVLYAGDKVLASGPASFVYICYHYLADNPDVEILSPHTLSEVRRAVKKCKGKIDVNQLKIKQWQV